MRRGAMLTILAGVLLFGLLPAAPVRAGDWLARLKGLSPHHQPPYWLGNPKQTVAAPPGPYRYPEYDAASGPWYGYGFGVPTYNWGYFGARYRPASICHRGYYGDFTQWGYRRGY